MKVSSWPLEYEKEVKKEKEAKIKVDDWELGVIQVGGIIQVIRLDDSARRWERQYIEIWEAGQEYILKKYLFIWVQRRKKTEGGNTLKGGISSVVTINNV